MKQSRRAFNTVMVGAAVPGGFGRIAANAQQNTVKLGMSLPLTRADAEDAMKIARLREEDRLGSSGPRD
jgi:branched-chain amino acid transport system substrate-binding protein